MYFAMEYHIAQSVISNTKQKLSIFLCLRFIIHVKWHNKIGNGITPTWSTVLVWSQIVLSVHMPRKHFCNTKWMIHIHIPSHTSTQTMTLQFFPNKFYFKSILSMTYICNKKFLIFKNSFSYNHGWKFSVLKQNSVLKRKKCHNVMYKM